MLRLASDENFNNDVVRGLRRRSPAIDVVRVQDTSMSGADDPSLLAWCATERRILLTHDQRTMPGHAYARVRAGDPMPGVIVADVQLPIGPVIEDILTMVQASLENEWEGQVIYLPL